MLAALAADAAEDDVNSEKRKANYYKNGDLSIFDPQSSLIYSDYKKHLDVAKPNWSKIARAH